MLVGQRSAAAHGDQSEVTLGGQDRHESHPLLITRRSSRQALAPLRRPMDDRLRRRRQRHPSFGKRRPLVVLMTTLFVTHRDSYFNDGGHLAARHR
jgi:hypothetical protein